MTELTLYNTLTRKKEPFRPIDPANVRMYVCGPTVYDFAHIGNARPVIVFDVLYRLLRHLYGESHVTYVRNITDVDDKINARALRDFPDLPLNEAIRKVTEKTANQFHDDVKALGCLPPTHEPRATDYVLPRADGRSDMVSIIQRLLDSNHAYVARGVEGKEVLFAVNSMEDYGKLSGRKLEDQQAGARIAVEAHKRNPADFVLWKESGDKTPGWKGDFTPQPNAGYEADFIISEQNQREIQANSRRITIFGRPGWHIECSAMSAAHLGETFDIHGGGLDLIFPHHENEIAQSRCAHGTDVMANVWMHNGFLQVEGRKMSKSDGNFFTIHELMNTTNFGGRKWPGEVLRLAMLMTHYREPIDFSVRRLEEAESILNGLYRSFERLWPVNPSSIVNHFVLDDLLDDLNSPSAIKSLIWETKPERLDPDKRSGGNLRQTTNRKPEEILAACRVLGILGKSPQQWFQGDLPATEGSIFATEESDTLVAHGTVGDSPLSIAISQRLAFLAAKDFANADRIRNELLEQGIQLKDSKDPVTGERVTTWEVKR